MYIIIEGEYSCRNVEDKASWYNGRVRAARQALNQVNIQEEDQFQLREQEERSGRPEQRLSFRYPPVT